MAKSGNLLVSEQWVSYRQTLYFPFSDSNLGFSSRLSNLQTLEQHDLCPILSWETWTAHTARRKLKRVVTDPVKCYQCTWDNCECFSAKGCKRKNITSTCVHNNSDENLKKEQGTICQAWRSDLQSFAFPVSCQQWPLVLEHCFGLLQRFWRATTMVCRATCTGDNQMHRVNVCILVVFFSFMTLFSRDNKIFSNNNLIVL